ncbi:MAG: CHASE2 domain-containing protein [Betaproteobacteria bacterium]|nr:CHASE2 domain-containing protein [Betaproteobacteria bacterium]
MQSFCDGCHNFSPESGIGRLGNAKPAGTRHTAPLMMPSTHRMSLGRALLVALAVALTLAVQWAPRVVPGSASAEAVLRDRLLRLMASDAPLEGAVIVDIDESSIAALGPWPWPRSRLADLAEQLLADGAQRVVFDMVLPEPSPDDAHGDERLASLPEPDGWCWRRRSTSRSAIAHSATSRPPAHCRACRVCRPLRQPLACSPTMARLATPAVSAISALCPTATACCGVCRFWRAGTVTPTPA